MASYAAVFVDNFSRWTHVECISSKAEVAEALQRYIDKNGAPWALHSDNGTEFTGQAFVDKCRHYSCDEPSAHPTDHNLAALPNGRFVA